MKWLTAAALALLISCVLASADYDLPGAEYSDISKATNEITKKLPPDQNVFVGVGRSPIPIIALLQLLHPGQAYNLPLSEFKYGPYDLSPEQRETLFAHFDRFLPNDATLNGKDLVLVDYCMSAKSLISAYYFVKEYFIARGRNVNVKIAPLVNQKEASSVKERFTKAGLQEHFDNAVVLRKPDGNHASAGLLHGLTHERYKIYSEYDAYLVTDPSLPQANSKYQELLAALRKRLMKDQRKAGLMPPQKSREIKADPSELAKRKQAIVKELEQNQNSCR